MNKFSEQNMALWISIDIDAAGNVLRYDSALGMEPATVGKKIQDVLPWFRLEWLGKQPTSRLVKSSPTSRLLLDAFPKDNGEYRLYYRNAAEYRNVEHLLCEVTDEIISIQKFVDTFYDGVFISDAHGKTLVVNDAWCRISGLSKEEVLGRPLPDLVKDGLIPFSISMRAIDKNHQCSAILQYPRGKKAFATSTPLRNNAGQVLRILTNVRDLSELNKLQQDLQEVTALSEGLQREVKALHVIDKNPHLKLTRSAVMESIYSTLTKVANTDLQLLITGSSGVGKTALAKLVHSIGERSNHGNFIHVNCSALPDTLLESELFGYEQGAFTGAGKGKVGLFDLANKGTLFLDEVGEMPISLQTKILNVLQEKCFYRIGGRKPIHVDVRIVAATNANLEKYIGSGKFREDLFYRLNVVPINIPRLAERREDIPPLISYYLDCCNARYQKNKVISPAAMKSLILYDWPGNIREIMNLLERLIVTVDEPVIDLVHLPVKIKRFSDNENEKKGLWKQELSLKEIIKDLEEKVVEEAIAGCGSFKEASEKLKIDVATLFRKRKRNRSGDMSSGG